MTAEPRDPVTSLHPAPQPARDAAPGRSRALRIVALLIAGLLFAGFFALGSWQLKRLQWKLALIERVEQRVHAPLREAPAAADWPKVNAADDEYRHVRMNGVFLYELTTRVQAVTELGSGYWLLTPLCRDDGSIVLVNLGFIASGGQPQPAPGKATGGAACRPRGPGLAPAPPSKVSGLLRASESGMAFLRHNDPAANRWYVRDVAAIAAARGLPQVAPYFVDADAGSASAAGAAERPVGGLTVISFHNNHLVYAVTWYGLALMVAGACWWVAREESRYSGKRSEKHGQAWPQE